jgi:hypothetical protein
VHFTIAVFDKFNRAVVLGSATELTDCGCSIAAPGRKGSAEDIVDGGGTTDSDCNNKPTISLKNSDKGEEEVEEDESRLSASS